MAVLTPAVLRAALGAFITNIEATPMGRVHTRRRIIRDDTSLKLHLYDQKLGKICGWMISPSPANTAIPDVKPGYIGHGQKGGGNVLTAFQFQIEGIHELNDAQGSEEVFHDLTWALADEFNAYGSIPGSDGNPIPGLDRQLPCSIEQFGFVMFAGSFLCHYARLELGFIGRTRPA